MSCNFATDNEAEYCDELVFLSVTLYVCKLISGTARSNFTHLIFFVCFLWLWLDPSTSVLQCFSGFVNEVICYITAPMAWMAACRYCSHQLDGLLPFLVALLQFYSWYMLCCNVMENKLSRSLSLQCHTQAVAWCWLCPDIDNGSRQANTSR